MSLVNELQHLKLWFTAVEFACLYEVYVWFCKSLMLKYEC